MNDLLLNQYSSVRYDDFVNTSTDPSALGALGRIFGLKTASANSCRVLELGCGQGLNLIALAARLPQAQFVGVDFIESGLVDGRALAAKAGVYNVELVKADLREFTWAGEPFDYVLAWGIFSWVPDDVKSRILAVARAALAPQGLVCLSYLTYPGCLMHEGLRDLMAMRADGVDGAAGKVEAARAVLLALSRAAAALEGQQRPAQKVWAMHAKDLLQKDPTVLFHDELGREYDPCYLAQFVDYADRHGLAYVCDVDTPAGTVDLLPGPAAQALQALSPHPLEQEQVSDYLTDRGLRVAVLTRDADRDARAFSAGALRGLWVGTSLLSQIPDRAWRQPQSRTFEFGDGRGGTVVVDDRLSAAFLHVTCAARGQCLPFAELTQSAQRLCDVPLSDDKLQLLASRCFGLLGRKLLTLSTTPRLRASSWPDRPRLSRLNRVLAEHRHALATPTHEMIRLAPEEAALLVALDGQIRMADLHAMPEATALGRQRAEALLALIERHDCWDEPAVDGVQGRDAPQPPTQG